MTSISRKVQNTKTGPFWHQSKDPFPLVKKCSPCTKWKGKLRWRAGCKRKDLFVSFHCQNLIKFWKVHRQGFLNLKQLPNPVVWRNTGSKICCWVQFENQWYQVNSWVPFLKRLMTLGNIAGQNIECTDAWKSRENIKRKEKKHLDESSKRRCFLCPKNKAKRNPDKLPSIFNGQLKQAKFHPRTKPDKNPCLSLVA